MDRVNNICSDEGGCMSNVVSMESYIEALEEEILAAEEAYNQALEAYKAAHDRLALALSKMGIDR